jgi:hypothetical protein
LGTQYLLDSPHYAHGWHWSDQLIIKLIKIVFKNKKKNTFTGNHWRYIPAIIEGLPICGYFWGILCFCNIKKNIVMMINNVVCLRGNMTCSKKLIIYI